jgi:hypothetical protein
MIEDVVEFRAELQLCSVARQRESFEERRVLIKKSWF